MNAIQTLLTAGAIVGVFASSAYAQVPTIPVQKQFSVKIGAHFFTDGDTKDNVGDTTLTVGIGYDFLKTTQTNPVVFQAYLDYIAQTSKDRTITVNQITRRIESELDYAVGAGVAARYMFNVVPTAGLLSPYGYAGLGIYSAKANSQFVSSNGTVGSRSENKTGVGGKIGIGLEVKPGFFGELEYNFLPKVADLDLSGFGARLGYRF